VIDESETIKINKSPINLKTEGNQSKRKGKDREEEVQFLREKSGGEVGS